MRSTLSRFAANLTTFAGAMALFCGLSTVANAQFQAVFGGGNEDAAQGGIIQAGDDPNGFIAVGHSSSFGADQDIYIVKTDKCGEVVWARTYNFGGVDIGRKIRQVQDEKAYIVVGSTENSFNCCTQNDAFLMKIDFDGNVIWARTYGGVSRDEGADVRPNGDAYYFAGRTASFGAGRYDAWLGGVRASDGSILWSRVYGGRSTDGFNALDLGCGGHLMAVGDTRSYTIDGNIDIYDVKTDLNGNISPTGWSRHYGGPRNEIAWSVATYYDKYYYVAGYTESVGNGAEGYIFKGLCETGALVNDITYGAAQVGGDDQFTEIQVNQFTGNLILTGFLQDAPGGFGRYDVWLQEVDPNLGFVFARVYGKGDNDQGWSVATVNGLDELYNYVIAGFNDSFGVFGGRDLYEIRTTSQGKVGCYVEEPKVEESVPGFKPLTARTASPLILVHCIARPELQENHEGKIMCSNCFDGGGLRPQQGGEELSRGDRTKGDASRVMKVSMAPKPVK